MEYVAKTRKAHAMEEGTTLFDGGPCENEVKQNEGVNSTEASDA
jgi:hypothetical protein